MNERRFIFSIPNTLRLTFVLVAFVTLFGCAAEPVVDEDANDDQVGEQKTDDVKTTSGSAGVAKLGLALQMVVDKDPGPNELNQIDRGTRPAVFVRNEKVYVDALIEVDKKQIDEAVESLRRNGVEVRTVTPSGIVTASFPLSEANTVAGLGGIKGIEAARRLEMHMDQGRGPEGLNVPGTYPVDAPTGAGVIVGVIDSGIDWKHADFRDANSDTRILKVWDHSDHSSGHEPPEESYGAYYDQAHINDCINGVAGTYCEQRDTHGHGTHVTGTAAGNGRARTEPYTSQYQLAGVAPEADIIFVKYDFEGDRNTTAHLVDAVAWIFKQAGTTPCVINMSLGSDFGPHDGSTYEERAISDLTNDKDNPSKIVVSSAGNAGEAGGRTPMHGDGTFPVGACSNITIEIDANSDAATEDDYIFFDIWYDGADSNRIQVTTPTGEKYPPNFAGANKRVWTTNGAAGAYSTPEGRIAVYNGGERLGWDSDNGDHELYVEISDYSGVNQPAVGTWTICIYGLDAASDGAYDGWHGTSYSLADAPVYYEGLPTDNESTIGLPASAHDIIAIGAYTTRMGWQYWDAVSDTYGCQTYNEGPLAGYASFYVDADSDGVYDRDYGGDCYYDSGSDEYSEDFHTLAYFSSRGPTRDGRTKPAVAGPGVGIASSLSADALDADIAANPDDRYYTARNLVIADGKHVIMQGTSMSAPHATGAVALILALDGSLDPAGVRHILTSTARTDVFTGDIPKDNPSDDWGYGKIDVAAALASIVTPVTCADVGAQCGIIDDGIGGTLDCGNCGDHGDCSSDTNLCNCENYYYYLDKKNECTYVCKGVLPKDGCCSDVNGMNPHSVFCQGINLRAYECPSTVCGWLESKSDITCDGGDTPPDDAVLDCSEYNIAYQPPSGCVDDDLEPNDGTGGDPEQAEAVSDGSDFLATKCPGNEDFYWITLQNTDTLYVTMCFDATEIQLDLIVYSPTWEGDLTTNMVMNAFSGSSQEQMMWEVPDTQPETGVYYIRVVDLYGDSGQYRFAVNVNTGFVECP
jgi:subtilisin family serine protease